MLPLQELVRHVRRQRRMLELTQANLAKAAGVSQSFVAKLERGQLQPGYESVRAVMEALDRARLQEEDRAGELMQSKPLWADPDEPTGEALRRMKEHGFSQLPVVEGGMPVGSLSESEILTRLERGFDLEALKRQPVRMLMSGSFPMVPRETRRHSLVELLREHDAVLVMDQARLVGVVTKSDLW